MSRNDLDYELLSAYLDNTLPEAERKALEKRLASDAALRRELDGLRQTVNLVRGLPTLRAPRDFTLTPEMARRIRRSSFFTSTAFSGLTAAAAMILMVFGALTFLLQSNANRVPVSSALMETTQLALQPTATTQQDLLPESAANADTAATGELEQAEDAAALEEAPSDGQTFDAQPDAGLAAPPQATPAANATLLFAPPLPGATIALTAQVEPFGGAAEAQPAAPLPAPQGAAPEAAMVDQFAAEATDEAQTAQRAAPTTTMTATRQATATATPSPAPSQQPEAPTPSPIPMQTVGQENVGQPQPDIFAPALFVLGVALLIVAAVTTWLRRRNR